jgi:hypothetical protein
MVGHPRISMEHASAPQAPNPETVRDFCRTRGVGKDSFKVVGSRVLACCVTHASDEMLFPFPREGLRGIPLDLGNGPSGAPFPPIKEIEGKS